MFSLRYWILLCSGVLVVPLVGSEITWFCESGSVTFPRGSAGREVVVVAGGEGDIVVRADFAGCPEPKMRFTLKPVVMRTVTIYPCEVLDVKESPFITSAHVEQLLQGVNDIYRQVGLQFVSAEVTTVVHNQWNKEGLVSRTVGNAIRNHMTDTGGVEVYFIREKGVKRIGNTKIGKLGSANIYGIILVKSAGSKVLAHELGHACRLADIYAGVGNVELGGDDADISREHLPEDWGYYRDVLDQRIVIEELLMHGNLASDRWYDIQIDIPAGSIFGLSKDSASATGVSTGLINVGENGMLLNPPYSH